MFHTKFFTFTFALTIIASLALYANAAQAQLPKEGLIGYWSFDKTDIEGNTVKNLAGDKDEKGETNGTIKGKLEQVKGIRNEALEFPGIKGNYLEIPKVLNAFASNFSVGFWFKTPTPAKEMAVFRPCELRGTFYIYFHPDKPGKLQVEMKGIISFIISNTVISADKWYHVLVSWGDGPGKLYLNGEEDGAYSGGLICGDSTPPHAIGASLPDGQLPFNGVIDEFYVYNRALSKDEVLSKSEVLRILAEQSVEVAGKLSISWGEIKEKAR